MWEKLFPNHCQYSDQRANFGACQLPRKAWHLPMLEIVLPEKADAVIGFHADPSTREIKRLGPAEPCDAYHGLNCKLGSKNSPENRRKANSRKMSGLNTRVMCGRTRSLPFSSDKPQPLNRSAEISNSNS